MISNLSISYFSFPRGSLYIRISCVTSRPDQQSPFSCSTGIIMSFLSSIQQFAGQSLSSINASARKLVSSVSTDSNGSTSTDATGPNIEVSETSSSDLKKRPPGPLLIRSPEVVASMPLSPGVHFSRRRPSLGISPSSGGRKSPFGNTLDPPSNSVG